MHKNGKGKQVKILDHTYTHTITPVSPRDKLELISDGRSSEEIMRKGKANVQKKMLPSKFREVLTSFH